MPLHVVDPDEGELTGPSGRFGEGVTDEQGAHQPGPGGGSDCIEIGGVQLGPNARTCFWGGWGGSLVVNDLENRLTVAYVMNRMAGGTVGDDRGIGVVLAAYAAVVGAVG